MGVSLGRSVLLVILAALLMASMAVITAGPADAAKHFQRQCEKIDKQAHQTRCFERNPDGVRGD
jgi:ABC-type enterobactin transport system permease subunit